MLQSDVVWQTHHRLDNVYGWNVMKVDMSLKFTRSKSAQVYMEDNSDFYSNWEKTANLRDMLLE